MKGITFGTLHSYNDLHLILNAKEIGSPNMKTRKIDIEGRIRPWITLIFSVNRLMKM